MNKYLAIYLSGLKNALEYRGALFTWILVELISLTSAVFIWTAIFKSHHQIGDYQYQTIILYYYLIPLVGAFTSVHFSEKLPRKIKDGELANDLLKPFSPLAAIVANQLAIKTIQNTLKIPVYLIVGLFLFVKFNFSLGLTNLLLGITACLMAYCLHAILDLTISLFAFWFDDFWSLSLIKYVMLMIFGGLSYPIDLIPVSWQPLFNFMPFDLVYFFPVSATMGSLSAAKLWFYFIKWLIWTGFLSLMLRLLWQKGVTKHNVYGQ